ncbi:MAG TPA: hypothetical protein VJ226_11330, partial [Bradyrhizobium sp.]|nr:hypothetical protein [Bradyrhizobium sp.]
MIHERNLGLEIVAIHPKPAGTCGHKQLSPIVRQAPALSFPNESPMQTLSVNGYDMAYLDVGEGPPL